MMRKTLGAMALLTLAGCVITSQACGGEPFSCDYTVQSSFPAGYFTHYRWVGTTTLDDCNSIAIEVPDGSIFSQSLEDPEAYEPRFEDVQFTRVDPFDPNNPSPGPSVWDVVIYMKDLPNVTPTIYARRDDVSINKVTIVPAYNGQAATLQFLDAGSDSSPQGDHYTFTLVRFIERELNDENNDLSTLAVSGFVQTLGSPGQETLIEVTTISSLTVTGDVEGDLTLETGRDFNGGSDSQLGSLVVEGDVLGKITVGSGELNFLRVFGNLGSPFDPIAIKTRGHIQTIIAGAVHADILPGNVGGPKKRLRYLETVPVGIITGDFIGTIDASEIGEIATESDGLLIRGNFGSTSTASIVKVEEPLGTENDHVIVRIGGGFYSPTPVESTDPFSHFKLPDDGLVGRMIINAEDDGGVWHPAAKIKLGTSLDLDDPLYNIPRASVGGGVAGLAPFQIYTVESKGVPGNGLVLFDWGPGFGPGSVVPPDLWECEAQTPEDVILQFYGGVEQTFPGTGDNGWPVSIWSDAENPFNEMREITDKFSFSFHTDVGHSYLKISRTTGSYETSGSYEIRYDKNAVDDYQSGIPALQKRGGLTLQNVTGSPRQESFTISIPRVNRCKTELLLSFDLNTDGDLCTQDVAEWMNNPVDLNGDETTCSQDVARLVQAINLYNSLD